MLSRLDPHTAFLEPDDFSAMREKQQGSFFGLGIQIQKRMGKITVIAPMEGTPAYKLGIRAGDIITHIEDEELKEDVSTDEVVRKLRGPKGTQVTITIRRAGIDEPIRMTITRAEIPTNVGPLRLHARRRRSATSCSARLHAHLQPRARRRHRQAREAGHEEAPARPARQPGRRARAGRGRQPTSSCRRARRSSTRAAARLPRPRTTSRPAKALTSTSRSSFSSTAARPRPRRSSPARSRTTTAGSSSDSARGARASSRASTRCRTAPVWR